MRCPRCSFDDAKLFPNCDHTFGCPKCGNCFVRKPILQKKILL